MKLKWRRESDREWWARWDQEHRWDELAGYNDRVSKGIVHTPEYVERMRREQEAFYNEMDLGKRTA